MTIFTQPRIEINLTNVIANYQTLQSVAGQAICAAVVKDDAYGLGAIEIAQILYEKEHCHHFFVAYTSEAQKIAPYIPKATIYVLQGIGYDSLSLFNNNPNFVPIISTPEMFTFFKQNYKGQTKPAIQIETGLNRLGFREESLEKLTKTDLKSFSLVISHLACADEQAHFMNERQLNQFKILCEKYFPDTPKSLSASDGVFLGPDFCFDMVRLGAALYGINTAPYRENQMKNVLTVSAPVLQIENLKKGDFVGYSATYRANTDKKIAIISIGYGDGLFRNLSNVGKVFFKTANDISEARIIGRVSMDNIICDISGINNVKVGDFAYLIDDLHTLEDMGRDCSTIAYEVLSRIGKGNRFIKKYIGN